METNRFAELLNPIRDLARNWDVDIAHCLEDYLEELGDTELGRERCSENNSITPHRQSLNFAEAALLIQGSAAVYSKKVEYVYALVYQALQHITSANKKDEKGGRVLGGSAASPSLDDSADLILSWSDDPSLLVLDDDDLDTAAAETSITVRELVDSGSTKLFEDHRMHQSEVGHMSHMSSSALMQSMIFEDPGRSGINMLSCQPDASSGALVFAAFGPSARDAVVGLRGASSTRVDDLQHQGSQSYLSHVVTTCIHYVDHGDSADDQHSVDMFEPHELNNLGSPDASSAILGQSAAAFIDKSGPCSEGFGGSYPATKWGSKSANGSLIAAGEKSRGCSVSSSAAVSDPLALFDPHSNVIPVAGYNVMPSKPLRVGKCYRVPATLSKVKVGVNAEQLLHPNDKENLSSFINTNALMMEDEFSILFRNCSFPRPTLTGLASGNHLRPMLSRIRSARREAGKYLARSSQTGHAPTVVPAEDEDWALSANDEGGAIDWDMHQPDSCDDLPQTALPSTCLRDEGSSLIFQNGDSSSSLEKDNKLSPLWNMNDKHSSLEQQKSTNVEKALSRIVENGECASSFEELCKFHMDNFLHNAESYARETELSRRIGDWITKLEPKLAAEEAREVFNIAKYANKVICDVSDILEKSSGHESLKSAETEAQVRSVNFSKIVENNPSYEVCRIFTACLQLANMGTIEISNQNAESEISIVPMFASWSHTVNSLHTS